MKTTSTIVLPGLDGTDLLLQRFVDLAPASCDAVIHALPDNPTDNYASLCDNISERICDLDKCHIIAESFSGPLGILLAHRFPIIVNRLTLVATFALSPTPFFARIIPWSILFRIPMPSLVARYFFVGSDKSLVKKLKYAIRQTTPQTLVRRLHCAMNVDLTEQLAELKCDIMYIRPKHDRIIPKRSMNTIVNTNPMISVCEIDGPHLILQTRPNQAWECILA